MLQRVFKNLSLRTRLIILTAFALVSVFATSFVAWRLVKTTQTFTVFQTENRVRSAAHELAEAIRRSPEGFNEQSFAPKSPAKPKQPPMPPPVAEALREYQDAFARLSAIALPRFGRVGGGYYRRSDDKIFGYVARDSSLPADIEAFSQSSELRTNLKDSFNDLKPKETRKLTVGNETFLLAMEPISPNFPDSADDSAPPNDLAAWTIERLPNFAASDSENFTALAFLILTTFGLCIFAFVTVRELRRDTANIKDELANLELNLETELTAPQTKEFAVVVAAINDLSRRLRTNLEKQKELETSLRQSEKLSALGRVVSGVAHEIRNPLAAIKLKIQIAQRKEIDKNLDSTFRVVTEEIERLDRIVKRLLEFGKAQNLRAAPVDLNELLRARSDFFADIAAQKNVVLERENLDDRLMIEGDENRLTEVFDNLLQNALKALETPGKISLRSSVSGNFARIEIADTGVGISRAEREKIFEPFFTTRGDGTGLGLSISREIVEAHGGKIYFESEHGRGAKFFVELPVK